MTPHSGASTVVLLAAALAAYLIPPRRRRAEPGGWSDWRVGDATVGPVRRKRAAIAAGASGGRAYDRTDAQHRWAGGHLRDALVHSDAAEGHRARPGDAHVFTAGYLFAWVIAGPDPAPRRPSVPARLVVLGVAVAGHAVLSQLL